MSNAPLILSDNLFENTILHPTFIVANPSSDDVAGHEAFRVADNLRDMTSWTPAGTNAQRALSVDCQASQVATTVVLDRGHNLGGVTITVGSFNDSTLSSGTSAITCTIPTAAGGLPGDPNGCRTADGAWWKTFTLAANRAWAVIVPAMGAGLAPIVTGLYLGTSYRFPAYMNAPFADDYDTDLQVQRNQLSRGAVRVQSRRFNFRRFTLTLDLDSTDYAAFDAQVRPPLRYGQPWWICFDDSDATHAGNLGLFQLAGNVRYKPDANPVHREIRSVDFEEVIPRLWV